MELMLPNLQDGENSGRQDLGSASLFGFVLHCSRRKKNNKRMFQEIQVLVLDGLGLVCCCSYMKTNEKDVSGKSTKVRETFLHRLILRLSSLYQNLSRIIYKRFISIQITNPVGTKKKCCDFPIVLKDFIRFPSYEQHSKPS